VISNFEEWNSRYIVLLWCSWFHNLAPIAADLQKIEQEIENL